MNPRLEDWFVSDHDLIFGRIYGHPRFKDGEIIRTSRVVYLDRTTGEARTKNTHYVLGKELNIEQHETNH